MELTYEVVEPFLISSDFNGAIVNCEFQTKSGEIVKSMGSIRRSNTLQSEVTRNFKMVAINQARMQATSLLRNVLGGGAIGIIGTNVLRSATSQQHLGWNYDETEKQGAIVEAFKKVQQYFPFDEGKGDFVKPILAPTQTIQQLSAFEQQLVKSPVKSRYDKEILARILVEIANADGNISSEEREFLGEYINPELGTVSSLLMRDPVSPIECEEVDKGIRETILMAAWVMSLIDFRLHPSEESILGEYADMFAIADTTIERIIKDAKYYVLEHAISAGTPRNELFGFADKLKLSHDDAERCMIAMKKRM
ncbi:MAG: hypothetical protein RLZZ292_1614 [Bacteroidota bacterium]|jgi:uncharacterized membrane protein YebE (DUF533 family)